VSSGGRNRYHQEQLAEGLGRTTMNPQKNSSFLLVVFACLVFALACSAVAAEQAEKKSQSPIQIEANHMMSEKIKHSVFFSGKVVAKQDDIVIRADEMTIYYNDQQDMGEGVAKSPKNIERLKAAGNIEITKGEWVATGENAEYFEGERKIILTGNTKVWQNNSLITGDSFTLYLDEGKSVVERSSEKNERVKAFFYPESDN
jgi:lipopolysaccharide export system protein LptA